MVARVEQHATTVGVDVDATVVRSGLAGQELSSGFLGGAQAGSGEKDGKDEGELHKL